MFKSIFQEFQTFINRGNALDLAVAFIMSAAFTKIVTSIVDDIITPLIGIFLGGVDVSNLAITLGNAHIRYGSFLQAALNFLIISFVIFMLVKALNTLQTQVLGIKKVEQKPEDVVLLTQIRDLLKAPKS